MRLGYLLDVLNEARALPLNSKREELTREKYMRLEEQYAADDAEVEAETFELTAA